MSFDKCFGANKQDCLSVGASTAIMGLLGSMVGYLILSWSKIPSK